MADKRKVTIVTHSSGFHTDDIFAVATLLLLLQSDYDVTVIRSRDMTIAEKADYLVDFGSVYDPGTKRFDHHQKGGAGIRDNGIPYASFGLVWKEFGEKLTGSLEVADRIDKSVVQPVDANDNGVSFIESKLIGLRPLDVGFMTSLFYPTWKEEIGDIDDIFLKLVSYAKFFLGRVIISSKDKFEAEELVLKNYNEAEDKRLIILDSGRYPWEEVFSKMPEPLYVVYTNMTDNTWSIKGVRDDLFKYKTRKKLPEAWGGKSGKELEQVTGVTGAVFAHRAGFMAVAKTKEAIMKLAEIALNS